MSAEQLNKLAKLSKPLVDYLRANYDPHTTIMIQDDLMRVFREEIGVPFLIPDDC